MNQRYCRNLNLSKAKLQRKWHQNHATLVTFILWICVETTHLLTRCNKYNPKIILKLSISTWNEIWTLNWKDKELGPQYFKPWIFINTWSEREYDVELRKSTHVSTLNPTPLAFKLCMIKDFKNKLYLMWILTKKHDRIMILFPCECTIKF